MNSFNWFMTAFKKYFDFTGRARRKEYWNFILIYLLILIPLIILDNLNGTISSSTGIGYISGGYMLFMLCPTLAVTTRRLHDTNRSGWWQLIYLVPIVGIFVIFICTLENSQPGDNQYGKNPRGHCIFIHY